MRDPAALFTRVPVNRTLGFTLVSCGEGQAVLTMPVREEYLQENGYLQGGLVSAVADTAAAYAFLPGLPEGRGMTGVELKVNFLRPPSTRATSRRGPRWCGRGERSGCFR